MIPTIATMLALLTIAVCSNLIRQEDERARGGTFVSVMALLAIVGAVVGTAYVWYLSFQVERALGL